MEAAGAEAIKQRFADVQASAGVSLEVALGKIAQSLDRQQKKNDRLYQLLHVTPITVAIGASGTIDYPDMLGPRDGFRWDLRRVAVSGFTAGTVTMRRNDANAAVLAEWTQPGEWTWSGSQWLAARDRLVFTIAGITGNVQVDGHAIAVSEQVLPDYLL